MGRGTCADWTRSAMTTERRGRRGRCRYGGRALLIVIADALFRLLCRGRPLDSSSRRSRDPVLACAPRLVIPALRQAQDRPGFARAGTHLLPWAVWLVIPALRQAQDRPGFARAGIQFLPCAPQLVIAALRQAQDRPGFARAEIQFLPCAPQLVIPAKAGIHFDLAIGCCVAPPRQMVSLAAPCAVARFRPPQRGPTYFSLLVQREDKQEKGHPELRARLWRVRVGPAGFGEARPCAFAELARIHARDPAG
jgi:hypothetical protein